MFCIPFSQRNRENYLLLIFEDNQVENKRSEKYYKNTVLFTQFNQILLLSPTLFTVENIFLRKSLSIYIADKLEYYVAEFSGKFPQNNRVFFIYLREF